MAYGLYSHIQSNRRRSVVLLIGLFLLVYLMTFAGALLAEVGAQAGYDLHFGRFHYREGSRTSILYTTHRE